MHAGVAIFAELTRRSPYALFSMSALDPESVGGAMVRLEERRWGGMQYLAGRLAEQDRLRADVTVEEAADVLWMLASFASFDSLYTGRGLSADEVATGPDRDPPNGTLCSLSVAGAGRSPRTPVDLLARARPDGHVRRRSVAGPSWCR